MIKYIKKDKSVLKYIIGIEKRQVEVSKFGSMLFLVETPGSPKIITL